MYKLGNDLPFIVFHKYQCKILSKSLKKVCMKMSRKRLEEYTIAKSTALNKTVGNFKDFDMYFWKASIHSILETMFKNH